MGELIAGAALREIQEQIVQLRSTVASLTEQNQQKDEEIKRLNQILLNMQRARFGQTSEKRTYVLGDAAQQITLFDKPEVEEAGTTEAAETDATRHAEAQVPGKPQPEKETDIGGTVRVAAG